jgi:hypothetical protein
MATVSRRTIGWLSGAPTSTTIPVMVLADTDAAVTIHVYTDAALTIPHSTPTFTVNASGGSAPTLSRYCDDRGTTKMEGAISTPVPDSGGQTWVAWVGHTTLTGLTANTRYHIKLTQGGLTEGTVSGDGISTCTAPVAGTDFRIWALTCDRIDDPLAPWNDCDGWGLRLGASYQNAYAHIHRWQITNPTCISYAAFVDDFGYADETDVTDTYRQSTGQSDAWGLAYNYGLAYYVLLGMGHDLAVTAIRQGREVSRAWALRNHNFVVMMWGDHEFTDQYGVLLNPYKPELFPAGSEAWNQLFEPLRVSASNRDTSAIHQGVTLGDVTIAAIDGITNCPGGLTNTSSAFASFYGNNQIDDVLDALDTAAPFKLLLRADGDKNLKATEDVLPAYYFHQQPVKDMCAAEWGRLYTRVLTGADPLSVMANAATNGTSGVLVALHGDMHRAWAGYNQGAAYSGHHAEGWAVYAVGQVNHHPKKLSDQVVDTCQPGVAHKGTLTYYFEDSGWYEADGEVDPVIGGTNTYSGKPCFSCVSVDIRGSAATKEMQVNLWDYRGVSVWNAIYQVGSNQQINKPRFAMQGRVT